MPYSTNEELPQNVQGVLPKHAQDIYREAFNNAWHTYEDAHKRRGNESRDVVAHKVAWAAVEKKYHKEASGTWAPNSSQDLMLRAALLTGRASC